MVAGETLRGLPLRSVASFLIARYFLTKGAVMPDSEDLNPIERAQLQNFIDDTAAMEKQNAELDKKEALKKLPGHKKAAIYVTKGIGILLGILLILALLGVGS